MQVARIAMRWQNRLAPFFHFIKCDSMCTANQANYLTRFVRFLFDCFFLPTHSSFNSFVFATMKMNTLIKM